METSDPLVSTTIKTSDSGLRASLHPLVLLTISDYITRHTLRRQTQLIVGALLGQQNGRHVTIEHAYDVKTLPSDSQGSWSLDESWFAERLQQYKDVHKEPALELVGWWTVTPRTGPGKETLGMHKHILQTYNESALLLAFHPDAVLAGHASGGKLPLTVYESIYESKKGSEPESMQVESAEQGLEMRFRELSYEVDTGEAEMISVDFVAKGGGNATAVSGGATPASGEGGKEVVVDMKGKGREVEKIAAPMLELLTAEEEEVISFLNTRANAIKMLHARISLLRSYLKSLPPSYLTTPHLAGEPMEPSDTTTHQMLRAILALSARLPLLASTDPASFQDDMLAEKSDVALVSLLGGLSRSIQQVREVGGKFAIVDAARRDRMKGLAHGQIGPGSWGGHGHGMEGGDYNVGAGAEGDDIYDGMEM